jgi:hypothetical protein
MRIRFLIGRYKGIASTLSGNIVFMKFNPKNFTASNFNWWENIFQGACIPGKKLPTVKKFGSHDILVGYRGKPWCFSARLLAFTDGRKTMVDIAVYDLPPEVVAANAKSDEYSDCSYQQIDYVPGWGYHAIALLRQEKEVA